MSSTFDQVATIIAETCDIPRDTITPDSHAIDDLGIDSLDFLDIAFAIDKAFGIKLPLEKWTQKDLAGKVALSPNTIARVERNEVSTLRGDTIAHMARVFKTSTDYLLGLSDNPGQEDKESEYEPAVKELVPA